MRNCKEIVKDYLKRNGFDGLTMPGVCGCGLDDFAPCCDEHEECVPAYKQKKDCSNCNASCDGYDEDDDEGFCFTPKKPKDKK
jgi:hypothetical protein